MWHVGSAELYDKLIIKLVKSSFDRSGRLPAEEVGATWATNMGYKRKMLHRGVLG